MTVTIRRAAADDAEAITHCVRSLGYQPSVQLVANKVTLLTGSSADTVLVAEAPAGGVVGVASVHILPLLHVVGNLARVTAIAVLESHRGKGIGRALMTAAETFAWQHDCRRIEVTSGDQRREAHAFYSQLGYHVDERRFIKYRGTAA